MQSSGISGSAGALNLFESLADTVWDWLGNARQLGFGFSEDTISDLTALEIAHRPSNLVRVKRVSKRRERFVGFDWMWVIRRPAMSPEVYVVQAKKLTEQTVTGLTSRSPSTTLTSWKYRPRARKSDLRSIQQPTRQIKRMIFDRLPVLESSRTGSVADPTQTPPKGGLYGS